MSGVASPAVSSLTAAMRYRDVAAAAKWLQVCLGFQMHSSVRNDAGVMVYAQVAFGNAMVMLAPIQDTALDRYMRQPDEIGGAETQSCYFYVADVAKHFARAVAAGAEIILPLEPYDSGGQGYSCRDPEGHIWTFGDFDPWGWDGGAMPDAASHRRPRRRLATALGVLAVLGASGAAAAWVSGAHIAAIMGGGTHASHKQPAAALAVVREADAEAVNTLQAQIAAEKAARESADQAARSFAAELERERGLSDTARREISLMQSRVSTEETARAEAEAKVASFAAEAERERLARVEAERKAEAEAAAAASHQAARLAAEAEAREAQAEADKLRVAKNSTPKDNGQVAPLLTAARAEHEAAAAGLRQAREELERERSAREAAERSSQEAVDRAEAAEKATAAAQASMTELKSQLATEQAAKRSAWNAINVLRKQASQVQRAKAAAAAARDTDGSAEPAPAAQPKRKQVVQRPQRKQRPRQQAPIDD